MLQSKILKASQTSILIMNNKNFENKHYQMHKTLNNIFEISLRVLYSWWCLFINFYCLSNALWLDFPWKRWLFLRELKHAYACFKAKYIFMKININDLKTLDFSERHSLGTVFFFLRTSWYLCFQNMEWSKKVFAMYFFLMFWFKFILIMHL